MTEETDYRTLEAYLNENGKVGKFAFRLNIPTKWYDDWLNSRLLQMQFEYAEHEGGRQLLTIDPDLLDGLVEELFFALPKLKKASNDDIQSWLNMLALTKAIEDSMILIHSIAED